jgi:hypothetical protein
MDTDTTSTIFLGQMISYMLPYFFAGLAAVWSAVLLPVLKRHFSTLLMHFSTLLTNDQWRNIDREAETAAGKIWAEAKPTISSEQITGVDPRIAFAVQECVIILKGTAETLGLTPEKIQEILTRKILASIGEKQVVSGPVPVSVK